MLTFRESTSLRIRTRTNWSSLAVVVLGLACLGITVRGDDATPEVACPREWFNGVRDRTDGIRDEEYDAYYRVLHRATQFPPSTLRSAAAAVAAKAKEQLRADPELKKYKYYFFANLVLRPHDFRGEPVSLQGYVKQLDSWEAGENDFGFKNLHQLHLFTGETENPYVIVCSELPADFPVPSRGNATNHVRVTGYFFKLWSYQSRMKAEGEGDYKWHAAPLILAHRVEYHPPPAAIPFSSNWKWALGVAGVLLLGLLSLIFRGRRSARQRVDSTTASDPSADLNQLLSQNHPPPHE